MYPWTNICRKTAASVLTHTRMISKKVLYADEASPPVRFVMMTASMLNLDVDIRKIDLFIGENLSEDYKKINPLRKVPAMVVDNISIIDSHAIAIYLCEQVKQQDLYPNDPLLRAKITELMFFNNGTLFRLDSSILGSLFARKWPVHESQFEEWRCALDFMELQLNKNPWLTGDTMRLCDLCAMCTISTMVSVAPLTDRHTNVRQWLKRFEDLPSYEINARGLKRLQHYVDIFKK